ncbi:1,3-beta-glucanosyltransferase, partial [Saitoella coloradoensis]
TDRYLCKMRSTAAAALSVLAGAAYVSAQATVSTQPVASVTLTASSVATSATATLTPVTIDGNAFFQGNDRFYVRGVTYQPGGEASALTDDPLANTEACERDIPYFEQLGINTIRVYNVDNSADHSVCMNMLQNAGIYLFVDVNTPRIALSRTDPAGSYNAIYLQHVFATVDAFKNYSNVVGFFAGNEVINEANDTEAAPYVKATLRDLKNYISKQSDRQIPVGYSAADISENRIQLAEYFNCGDDATARADFYAFNSYSWCGDSSYTTSGFSQRVEDFSNYSIPLFFSEYGCNLVSPRPFTEVGSIYSENMTPVFSGGLVYEWTQESNNYGLVEVNGTSITPLQDYENLMEEFAKTSNPSGDGGYKTNGTVATCPSNQTYFEITFAAEDLPAIPSAAQAYIDSGAGKALGNDGPTNQGQGSTAIQSLASAGTATASGSSAAASGANSSGTSSPSSGASNNGMGLTKAVFALAVAMAVGMCAV